MTRTYTHVQANTNPTITNTIHVQHIPDRFNFLSVVCRSLALFTPRRFFSRLVSASSSSAGLTQGAFHRRSVCAYGAGEVDHLVRQALLQVALSPEGSLTVLCEFDALAATVRSRARTRARTFALSRGGGVRRGLYGRHSAWEEDPRQ